jgi:hypothetical protein
MPLLPLLKQVQQAEVGLPLYLLPPQPRSVVQLNETLSNPSSISPPPSRI